LLSALPKAVSAIDVLGREGLNVEWASEKPGYAAITLHRPSNVDDAETLSSVVATLGEVAARMPVIWPIHPRTRANIEKFGLADQMNGSRIACLPPQGYLQMVGLMHDAALLSDSGGFRKKQPRWVSRA
jgi:UDP-N-acetylglucosamine 2-epimerase (non-hydrolysing)